MIDILKDELLTPAQLAARIPVVGEQRPSDKMVRRWAKYGVGGIKLESVRIGHAVATTWAAFERFTRARSGLPTPAEFVPSEADYATVRELEHQGI